MLPVLAVGACAVGEDLADDPSFHRGADAGFAATGSPGAGGTATQGSASGTPNNDAATGTGSALGAAGTTASGDVGATGSGGAETAGTGSGLGGGGGEEGTAGADAGFDGSLAVDSASGCVSSQKSCGGRCVVPSPSFGCGLSGCVACAASPAHGVAKCTGLQCDFDCSAGYAKSGASCVASEGVSDGSTGDVTPVSEGDSGSCVASQCGGCIPFIQSPCCKADKSCGCQYPFAPCK